MPQPSNGNQEQSRNPNNEPSGQMQPNIEYNQGQYPQGYYAAPGGNQNVYENQPVMEKGYPQQPMNGYPPQTPSYHQQYSRGYAQYQPLLMQTGPQANYPPAQPGYPLQPQMQSTYNQNAPQGYPTSQRVSPPTAQQQAYNQNAPQGYPTSQRVSPPTAQQQAYNQNAPQGYPTSQRVSPAVMHQQQPHMAADIVNQQMQPLIEGNNMNTVIESANKIVDAYANDNSLKTPYENTMTPAHNMQANVAQQPEHYQQPIYYPPQALPNTTQVPTSHQYHTVQPGYPTSQRVSPPTAQQQAYNQNAPQGYPTSQRVSPAVMHQQQPHMAADIVNQQMQPQIEDDNKSKIMNSTNGVVNNYTTASSVYTPYENAKPLMSTNQDHHAPSSKTVQQSAHPIPQEPQGNPPISNLEIGSPAPQQNPNQPPSQAPIKEEQTVKSLANGQVEEDKSNDSKTKLIEMVVLVILIALLLILGIQWLGNSSKKN